MENLSFFVDMFNPDGLAIVIPAGDGLTHFRAILDPAWLRVDRGMLRSLYGGYSPTPWTIVGQVTFVPGFDNPDVEENDTNSELPTMLDPFTNMFRSARVLERMFMESRTTDQLVVAPIAIYRELQVATEND